MALARSVSTSLWGRRAEAPAPSRPETHRERTSEGEAWPRGGCSLQKGVAGPLLDGPPAPRKASPSGPHTPQRDGCCSSAAAGPPRLPTERSGPPGRRPRTAPRAGLRLPRLGIVLHFQSEGVVCKDADSSRETPSVRPYRLPRAPKDIGRRCPAPEASGHIALAARKAPSLSSGRIMRFSPVMEPHRRQTPDGDVRARPCLAPSRPPRGRKPMAS